MNFSVSTELCIDIFKKQRDWFAIAADHLQLNCNDLLIARDLAELAADDSDEFLQLLLLLSDAVNKGSLCLLVGGDVFAHQVSLLGADVELMRQKARNLPAFFDKENPLLIFENGSLYFQKYYKNERLLEEHLENLVKQQLPIASPEKISAVVGEVISSMKYSLEPLQIQAMLCSLLNSFSIISGGPGTGKTTIMVAILRSLLRLGHKLEDIQLAAPTGRAAKRMTEAVRQGINELEQQDEVDQQILSLEAGTLHRLLGAGPEGFNYHQGNKISTKVIVIDEVSMVDISMMNSFLQALPEDGCRLIFLGDQFQLPSDDDGEVLADLMQPTSSSPHFSASFKRHIEDSLPLTQMKFSEERRGELLAGMTVVDET
ncbi:MAG: AAA family ATPase, partial [Lentisphaeraceae bacterium]|nr:AAA family ATPase [Lentisphaeraceae bacterium]